MMDVVTVNGNQFITAALGVSLALLCLVIVLWVLKNRTTSSAFMRVVRSRNPRIQILDAAAVDARRRLVLVRRDNVEHLIMIGGPTDLVIETRIGEDGEHAREIDEDLPQRIAAAQRQLAEPAPAAPAARTERPRAAPQPPAAQPARPAPAPAPVAARAATPAPARPVARQPEPAPQPMSAYQEQDHYDLDEDDVDNNFFYDEFYDEGPSEEEALADLLEASRERIFSDREAPQPIPQRAAQPQPHQVQRQARAPQQQPAFTPSDFERVLEEEIAQHMAQPEPVRMVQPRPAAPVAAPRPAPARPAAPQPAERQAERRQPDARPMEFQQQPEERRAIAAPPAPSRPQPPQALRPAAASASRPTAPMRAAAAIASAPAGRSSQPNLQNEIARIFGEMSSKREK